MSEKTITSEKNITSATRATIAGTGEATATNAGTAYVSNLHERIKLSTLSKGMQNIPSEFDNSDGDWQCIKSDNPFEVLFLDYRLYKLITPEIVKSNYTLLEKFWKDKQAIMMTGGNRVQFNKKYGEALVENSTIKLQNCYRKISTKEGIENYYDELNNERLQKGYKLLEDRVSDMFSDGVVSPDEIRPKLEDAGKYDLSIAEVASYISSVIQKKSFIPYGKPDGLSDQDKLLSVIWMNNEKLIEYQRKEEEAKRHGREIFEGQYAYSIEEIGELMFNNENEAKEYLKDNLIINSIDYFSSAKAKQVKDISKAQSGIHLKYLQVVYKLNNRLPYKFKDQTCSTTRELATHMLGNISVAKEHLKSGYLEVWIKECHKEQSDNVASIIRNAENIDLAILEMVYTFDKTLPYFLGRKHKVTTPLELCTLIDSDIAYWKLGATELYDKSITTWLTLTGKQNITENWFKVQNSYKNKPNNGLEAFLHILNPALAYPHLVFDKKEISYPKINSLALVKTVVSITNTTRGFASFATALNKKSEGVSIGPVNQDIHHLGKKTGLIELEINPSAFKRGEPHKFVIIGTTEYQSQFEIPVAFKIAFPIGAFAIHLVKMALLFAIIAALSRGVLALLGFDQWLQNYYSYFMDPRYLDFDMHNEFKLFPVALGLALIIGYIVNRVYKKYIFT